MMELVAAMDRPRTDRASRRGKGQGRTNGKRKHRFGRTDFK